jgi:hypothetical protein
VKLVDGDALYATEIHQSLEKYRVLTQEHAPVTNSTMNTPTMKFDVRTREVAN